MRVSGTDSPYPNPSPDGSIQIEAVDKAIVRLTDLGGREIEFSSTRINEDVIEITPKQRLPAGVYMIQNNGSKHKIVLE